MRVVVDGLSYILLNKKKRWAEFYKPNLNPVLAKIPLDPGDGKQKPSGS